MSIKDFFLLFLDQFIILVGSMIAVKPKFENSYRLPTACHISSQKVINVIRFAEKTLISRQSHTFDLLKVLDLIRLGLKKEKDLRRFKLVVTGFVVQNDGQDVKSTSRCLWSSETDFSSKYFSLSNQ